MFSYVFMKILEGRPEAYDRGMDRISRGRVGEIKEAVAAAVPPGCRVLEIGCGTGELAALLIARGHAVDGFDTSRRMVETARARIEREDLGDRFTVRRMAVDGMDQLPDETYGAVVSTLVFSELSDDERRYALRHAARVLEPGGLLVLADEVVPRTAGRRLAHALIRAPALMVTYLASGSGTRPIADLAGEMASVGFSVLEESRSHGGAFAVIVGRRDGDRR